MVIYFGFWGYVVELYVISSWFGFFGVFQGISLGVVWALVSVFENAAAFSKPERFHGAVLWFLDRPCSVKPFSWYSTVRTTEHDGTKPQNGYVDQPCSFRPLWKRARFSFSSPRLQFSPLQDGAMGSRGPEGRHASKNAWTFMGTFSCFARMNVQECMRG